MRIVVVGGEDEVIGFSLAGLETVKVENEREFIDRVGKLLSMPDVGIVVVVDRFFHVFQTHFTDFLKKRAVPAVVFIPSFDGIHLKKDLKGYIAGVLGIPV